MGRFRFRGFLQDPLVSTPSFTALSITYAGLVMTLKLAFETLWEQGSETPECLETGV